MHTTVDLNAPTSLFAAGVATLDTAAAVLALDVATLDDTGSAVLGIVHTGAAVPKPATAGLVEAPSFVQYPELLGGLCTYSSTLM